MPTPYSFNGSIPTETTNDSQNSNKKQIIIRLDEYLILINLIFLKLHPCLIPIKGKNA